MQLKILSWNIWLAGDLEEVARFVEKEKPDVIGIQEVMPGRSPNILDAMTALGYESYYSSVPEIRVDGKEMGNAIFSKFPILEKQTHELSEERRRIAEVVAVDVHGTRLTIACTHLIHTHQTESELQLSQIEKLLA